MKPASEVLAAMPMMTDYPDHFAMVFEPPARHTGRANSTYKLLSGCDLDKMPPVEWRVKHILPARGVAQIFGATKSGKSFLVFDMCAAIAEGRTWFGYRVRKAPVVYVVLEGEAGFRRRKDAWCRCFKRELPNKISFVMQPWRIDNQDSVADLGTAIPAGAVVIVDTQNCAAPTVDENSAQDMGRVVDGAKALQRAVDGLVVLVTHTGHASNGRPRGSSVQTPAMDASIEVTRNGDRRCWIARKVKDDKDGASHGFQLRVVELGKDEDGEVQTSCVVAPETGPIPQAYTGFTLAGLQAYKTAGMRGLGLVDAQGRFAGVRADIWRRTFGELSEHAKSDTLRHRFNRCRKQLENDGVLTTSDGLCRITLPELAQHEDEFRAAALQRDTRQTQDGRAECSQ